MYGDVAKGRSLERSFIGRYFGFVVTADVAELAIAIDAFANIVKFAVGEERVLIADGMTDGAVASLRIFEDGEPSNLGRRERLFISAKFVAVEGGVAAENSALEAGERLLYLADRDAPGSEGLDEHLLVRRDLRRVSRRRPCVTDPSRWGWTWGCLPALRG